MSHLSEKLLKEIKERKLQKIPRWRFVAKNGLIWGTLIIAVLIFAFSLSMVMYQVYALDWKVLSEISDNDLELILKATPYFWLIIAAILFAIVYFDFRKTKTGYRYRSEVIILVALVSSALLGGGIFVCGASQNIEPVFENARAYKVVAMPHHKIWVSPEQGLLSGKIIEVKVANEAIYIRDLNGKEWSVIFSEVPKPDCPSKKNSKIKLIGAKIDELTFRAKDCLPWRTPRLNFLTKP